MSILLINDGVVWACNVCIWQISTPLSIQYLATDSHKRQTSKSEGFDSWNRPSNLTPIEFKSSIFQPVWPWHLMNDLKSTGHLLYTMSNFMFQLSTISEYQKFDDWWNVSNNVEALGHSFIVITSSSTISKRSWVTDKEVQVNWIQSTWWIWFGHDLQDWPGSKVHGTNMGPTWGR